MFLFHLRLCFYESLVNRQTNCLTPHTASQTAGFLVGFGLSAHSDIKRDTYFHPFNSIFNFLPAKITLMHCKGSFLYLSLTV